jgi:hypothetical protein
MLMEYLPIDICASILNKTKLKYLIGDMVLERFVVKYVDVDTQEMLYILVKEKRLETLILYITRHFRKVQCVSTQCIKQLIELSVRQRSFTISIVLCKAFANANRLSDVCHEVVKRVVSGYLKAHSESLASDCCIVCKAHIAFLEYFLVLCHVHGIRSDKLVRRCDLVQWLGHKSSHHLVELLLQNGCLAHIIDALAEDVSDRYDIRIVNAIIGSGNITLMNAMVIKGYHVMVCDVIVGIAMANYEMLDYLCKYFKPRWYSKKFRGILVSIASKRGDERIYQLVKAKLCVS